LIAADLAEVAVTIAIALELTLAARTTDKRPFAFAVVLARGALTVGRVIAFVAARSTFGTWAAAGANSAA
jgi:hypothetical protein